MVKQSITALLILIKKIKSQCLNETKDMHPFEFKLSFRAFHSSADLEDLFNVLSRVPGLVAGKIWKANDDYFTQTGDRLIGKRKESYFFLSVNNDFQEKGSTELLDVLEQLLANLQKVKNDLQEHVIIGGRLEFYLSLYGSSNFGVTFPGECIKALADFPIELSIDIYPEEETPNNGK